MALKPTTTDPADIVDRAAEAILAESITDHELKTASVMATKRANDNEDADAMRVNVFVNAGRFAEAIHLLVEMLAETNAAAESDGDESLLDDMVSEVTTTAAAPAPA